MSEFRDSSGDAPGEPGEPGEPEEPEEPEEPNAPVPPRPTKRRIEVLLVAAAGLELHEASDFLGIAHSTYRNHSAELRSEFNVRHTLEVFICAQLLGYVNLDDLRKMQARIRRFRQDKEENR